MKAAVVVAKGKIDVMEVPEPVLGEYDALCEILACGVCSGTDNHILEDAPYHRVAFPAILGHEAIGRVKKLGEKVRNLRTGDLVSRVRNTQPPESPYTVQWGGMAERGIVTDWEAMRDDGLLENAWRPLMVNRVLPINTDPILATMLITWRETYSFLSRMEAFSAQNVVIIGTGGNALAFVEHLKNAGIHAFVIGSGSRGDVFLKAGAKALISYKTDTVSELQTLGIAKIDIIIDAIGRSENLNVLLPLLRSGGRVGVYGLDEFLDYKIEETKATPGFKYYSGEEYDEGSAHDAVMRDWTAGNLDPWLNVSKEHFYPLTETQKALQASKERRVIKSVITF